MDHNEFFNLFGTATVIPHKVGKGGHAAITAEELYQHIKKRLLDDLRVNVRTASNLARLQEKS